MRPENHFDAVEIDCLLEPTSEGKDSKQSLIYHRSIRHTQLDHARQCQSTPVPSDASLEEIEASGIEFIFFPIKAHNPRNKTPNGIRLKLQVFVGMTVYDDG